MELALTGYVDLKEFTEDGGARDDIAITWLMCEIRSDKGIFDVARLRRWLEWERE